MINQNCGMIRHACLVLGFIFSIFGNWAIAQNYPTKPVTMIIPGTPGGGMDVIARALADRMSKTWNQSFMPENKPGANGNIAAELVTKSRPDGYTIFFGQTAQLAINPALYKKLPFDPLTDLVPVVLLASAPNVILVEHNSPFKTLQDVVKAARSNPKELNLATPGNGTPSHLISELFQKTADIQLTHVPYKGATGALTDLIGGRVSLMMSSVPTALGQIKNGKIRAIAVSASKRIHVLPDVPTIGESGYSGFQIGTWYGLFVPKNTPSSIVLEINSAANESLKTAVLNEKILAEGGVVLGGDSQSFANLVKADFALWGKIVKESGAVID